MGRNLTSAFTSGLANNASSSTAKVGINGLTSLAQKSNSSFNNQMNALGLDADLWMSGITGEGVVNDLTNKENWNTAASVASKYLQSKIDRIKDAWNTKVDISIGALIGEATPFVKSPSEAVSLLVDKIDDLILYMVGVDGSGGNSLKSLVDDIGTDALEYMMNDPAMQQVISGLTVVKMFGQAMEAYNRVEKFVVDLLGMIEPLIPVLQIVTNLASAYFSGGTSAAEAAQETSELVAKYSQQLIALAMGALRRYVFTIKVKVPSLVVGALNSLSVREAMRAGDWGNDWLKSIFDEDFYNQTMYSLQWQDSINEAIQTTLGSYADKAKNALEGFNFTDSHGRPITRGEFMKTKFMTTLTSSFMASAKASARKTAYITDIDNSRFLTTAEAYSENGAEIDANTGKSIKTMDDLINSHLSNLIKVNSIDTIMDLSKIY